MHIRPGDGLSEGLGLRPTHQPHVDPQKARHVLGRDELVLGPVTSAARNRSRRPQELALAVGGGVALAGSLVLLGGLGFGMPLLGLYSAYAAAALGMGGFIALGFGLMRLNGF